MGIHGRFTVGVAAKIEGSHFRQITAVRSNIGRNRRDLDENRRSRRPSVIHDKDVEGFLS
jgi:hypothetical protein